MATRTGIIPNSNSVPVVSATKSRDYGSIVWETCATALSVADLAERLDRYGRNRIGGLVPVSKSDSGCCGRSFGGELARYRG